MVINNLNIPDMSIVPNEIDTPLLVDAYAVLPFPITRQALQPIGRWNTKGFQLTRRMQHRQLHRRSPLNTLGQPF